MSHRWLTQLHVVDVSLAFVILAAVAMSACAPDADNAPDSPDAALQARVAAAISSATDLPANAFSVSANDGAVTISGSVTCEDCGGLATPPGIKSIQQTLGAVVRAVPGVRSVEFELEY